MFSVMVVLGYFFFFKQKTAYEMRISDWSSDVCSSDLAPRRRAARRRLAFRDSGRRGRAAAGADHRERPRRRRPVDHPARPARRLRPYRAPGRRRLRSRRARRRDRGVRGMTSLLRTIFVVARRDFLAIVATPTFLLFLLAPLFMIGMGAIGGFGASQLADSARGAGRIVIFAAPADIGALRDVG